MNNRGASGSNPISPRSSAVVRLILPTQNSPPMYLDNFAAKRIQYHTHIARLKSDFHTYGINTNNSPCDTYLVELILKSSFRISDSQMLHILGLNQALACDRSIYAKLLVEIQRLAIDILTNIGYDSLLSLPLTNIKEGCDMIADNFKTVFDLTYHTMVDASYPESAESSMRSTLQSSIRSAVDAELDAFERRVESIRRRRRRFNLRSRDSNSSSEPPPEPRIRLASSYSKFNQSWPVVYLLKREYEKCQESRRRGLNPPDVPADFDVGEFLDMVTRGL